MMVSPQAAVSGVALGTPLDPVRAIERTLNLDPIEHRIQTGATFGGPIVKNIMRRNFPMTDSQVKVDVVDQNAQVWVG
jgi:hypothetical protein